MCVCYCVGVRSCMECGQTSPCVCCAAVSSVVQCSLRHRALPPSVYLTYASMSSSCISLARNATDRTLCWFVLSPRFCSWKCLLLSGVLPCVPVNSRWVRQDHPCCLVLLLLKIGGFSACLWVLIACSLPLSVVHWVENICMLWRKLVMKRIVSYFVCPERSFGVIFKIDPDWSRSVGEVS